MDRYIPSIATRRFGRTEINMPVLSLGGMRFQQSWNDLGADVIEPENQKKLERILQLASQNGMHHLETARHYGSSEIQLGFGMKKVPDRHRIVQTKIQPQEDPNAFEKELERSFLDLQCKKVDLLSIHGVNITRHLEQVIRPGGCLEVVRRWQKEGRIDFVGFSTHGPTDLIIRAIETNEFDYVNLHWYFIFQNNEPALAAAANLDLGVFIISPTDKGGHLHSPSSKLLELCAPLHPIVFNDSFCLSDKRVHTLSVGISNPKDFSLHLDAVKELEGNQTLLPKIIERLTDCANRSLGEDWMITWNHQLPTWDQTPGEINIPILMWLYNLYKAWEMDDYVKARYRLLGNASHWFQGANSDCLDREVSEGELKRALQLSPWTDEIINRLRELRDKFSGEATQRLSLN